MAQGFENIANELRHQYNIAYSPEPLATTACSTRFNCELSAARSRRSRRAGYYALKM